MLEKLKLIFNFYIICFLTDAKTTLCGIDIILKFKTNKNKQVYESICNKLFLFLLEYDKKLSNVSLVLNKFFYLNFLVILVIRFPKTAKIRFYQP